MNATTRIAPNGPVERHLDNLDASVEHVRELVSTGREMIVEESAGI